MTTPDIIFVTGTSGAGKGTQARMLSERLGYFHWEMGAILREETGWKLKSGHTVGEIINEGHFLSDDQLMEVVLEKMDRLPKDKGIIFDGIPRRLGQAKILFDLLRREGRDSFAAIQLDIDPEDAVERLLKRAEIEGRADDNPKAIERRLKHFEEETVPAIEFMKQNAEFHLVDGRGEIEEVARSVRQSLGLE